MSFNFDINVFLNIAMSAGAVYAALRADMAAMHVRIDHLERDLYGNKD